MPKSIKEISSIKEIPNEKLTLAVQEQLLNSVGISMETYNQFNSIHNENSITDMNASVIANTNAVTSDVKAESGDVKMESEDEDKPKRRVDMLKDNQVGIFGVLIRDEAADMYRMFGFTGFTSPADVANRLENMVGDIELVIDSPGGDTAALSTIMKLLEDYKENGKISAVIEGMAASAASMIMLAADEVQIAEFAKIMIHSPWGCFCGDGKKLESITNHLLAQEDDYAGLYAKKTGGDKEKMLELMRAETWFTASEAVNVGLVNSVYKKPAESNSNEKSEGGDKDKESKMELPINTNKPSDGIDAQAVAEESAKLATQNLWSLMDDEEF